MNTMSSSHCYSIVLGGKFGVGKSSLFRRLKSDVFTEDIDEAGGGADKQTIKTTVNENTVEVGDVVMFVMPY